MSEFLTLDDVLAIHAEQIRVHGGAAGIRDFDLLSSAIAMPEVTFNGALLHQTLAEQAAAYLFYLAKNHPFIDGNKRTALGAALTFLLLNGIRLGDYTEDELSLLVENVAAGQCSKAKLTVFIEGHSRRA